MRAAGRVRSAEQQVYVCAIHLDIPKECDSRLFSRTGRSADARYRCNLTARRMLSGAGATELKQGAKSEGTTARKM